MKGDAPKKNTKKSTSKKQADVPTKKSKKSASKNQGNTSVTDGI
jgi:hypothetical protein